MSRTAEQARAYYAAHKERINELARNRRAINGEQERAKARAYHAAHKELRAASHKRYRDANKERLYARQKKSREVHKDRIRARRLRNNYGISTEQWNELFSKQNGLCAICQEPLDVSKGYRHIHVDHCHDTNVIRGLLCYWCNTGLGMFRDNPNFLNRATQYLERNTNHEQVR